MPATIATMLDSFGISSDIHSDLPLAIADSLEDFRTWPAECHCGQECQKIAEAALTLVAVSDISLKSQVWRVAIKAMAIVCHG